MNTINNQSQSERTKINDYLGAKHLRDISEDREVLYNIEWHGSIEGNQRVTDVYYIGCQTKDGQDEALIVLWISEELFINDAVVCARSNLRRETRESLVKTVSNALGKALPKGGITYWFPAMEVTLDDKRSLFDVGYWRQAGHLRHGDSMLVPNEAVVFARENTIIDSLKTSVWFYWFADAKGQILGTGMTGS